MQNVVCTYLMSLAVLINTKLTQKHDRLSQTLFQLCLGQFDLMISTLMMMTFDGLHLMARFSLTHSHMQRVIK